MNWLHWLDSTPLATYLASDPYANPVLLCVHAIGMGIVVGIVWMLDLRLLGFPRSMPLSYFGPLLGLAWIGFALNAASGLLLFMAEASRLIVNTDFLVKIACICLGGLSVWAIQRTMGGFTKAGPETTIPAGAKILAVVCFSLWLVAIVAGRYIGYTLAPPAP